MPPAMRAKKGPTAATTTTTNNAAVPPPQRDQTAALAIAFARYLRWLVQLQGCVDAACDDAYKLDRLLLQGVLPLRPRTVPPPVLSTGLKAAVYELVVGSAEREAAAAQRSRQLHRTWKLTGASQEPAKDRKAATFSHFPTAAADSTGTAGMTHTSTPPCPCTAFHLEEQQQLVAGARHGSRSSGRHNSTSEEDSDGEGDHVHAEDAKRVGVLFGVASSGKGGQAVESKTGSPPSHPHHEAALSSSSSFAARLKDAVRTGSGTSTTAAAAAAAGASPPHKRGSIALSLPRSPGSASTSALPPPPQQLLLPVAAVEAPPRLLRATDGEDTEEADQGKKNGGLNEDDIHRPPHRHSTDGAVAANDTAGPIPVDPATLPRRSLHPAWSSLAAEELRRCPLCGGQLLLMSAWQALYLLQLLTMVSACPAMAAPLPLVPPSVLKLQPVEALLLLFQTTQRCFIAGLAMAATVSLPHRPIAAADESRSTNTPSRSAGPTAAMAAGSPPLFSLSSPSLPSAAAAAAATTTTMGYGVTPSAEAVQLQGREDALMSGLAQRVLGVAHVLGGYAAAQLWPREALAASSARESRSTLAHGISVVDLHGAVLALRCRVFHCAFSLLMTEDGAMRGVALLAVAAHEAVQLAAVLHASASSPAPPRSAAAGVSTEFVYGAVSSALTWWMTAAPSAPADGDATRVEYAVLHDDVRALHCVVALLTVFAELIHAQEPERASCTFDLSPAAVRLLDAVVQPTLLELQNSSRGNCGAQARLLLALWWLLRAETVRQWVYTSSPPPPTTTTTTATTPNSTLRVLDSEVSLVEGSSGAAVTAGVVHWSAWLKYASRAAVRASNAASEFLGVSFHPSSALGSPSPLLLPTTRETTLRWWLPVVPTPATAAAGPHTAVLPLPWVRMWLLLCPPLFHVSPTDVLALRQTVQQHAEGEEGEEEEEERERERERGSSGTTAPATTTAAGEATATRPLRERRSDGPARGASKPAKMSTSRRGQLPPVQSQPTAPDRGQRTTSPAPSATSTAQGFSRVADLEALQQRLRVSTAPLCFWARWSRLFDLDGRQPRRREAKREGTGDSVEAAAGTHDIDEDDDDSPVASAIAAAVAVLRHPAASVALVGDTHATAAAPSLTHLTQSLQAAFPVHSADALTSALAAESQRFWPEEVSSSNSNDEDSGALFVRYAFTSHIPSLRAAVRTLQHAAEASQPVEDVRQRSPQPIALSPSPPRPLQQQQQSSTSTPPSRIDGTANDDNAPSLQPPTTAATAVKRPPLMAARKLPRRAADSRGSTSPLPTRNVGAASVVAGVPDELP